MLRTEVGVERIVFGDIIMRALAIALVLFVCCSSCLAAGEQAAKPHVTLQLGATKLKSVVDAVFAGTGLAYSVDDSIKDLIVPAVSVKDAPIDSVLRVLSKSADFTFRVENGSYLILPLDRKPKDPESPGKSNSDAESPSPAQPASQPAPKPDPAPSDKPVPAPTDAVGKPNSPDDPSSLRIDLGPRALKPYQPTSKAVSGRYYVNPKTRSYSRSRYPGNYRRGSTRRIKAASPHYTFVRGYFKRNGKYVRGHIKRSGSRAALTIPGR